MISYCDMSDCVNNIDGECSCTSIDIYNGMCDSYQQKLLDKDPKDAVIEILNRIENQKDASVLKAILFNDIDNIICWDSVSKSIAKYLYTK